MKADFGFACLEAYFDQDLELGLVAAAVVMAAGEVDFGAVQHLEVDFGDNLEADFSPHFGAF